MKNISLVSIIYFLLSVNAVRTFGSFMDIKSLVFLTPLLYILIIFGFLGLLYTDFCREKGKNFDVIRLALVAVTLIIIIAITIGIRLEIRKITTPENTLNDSAYMTETASTLLISGKNPYIEHYEKTPFGQFWLPVYKKYQCCHETIEYYVYLPFFLLANTFFQIVMNGLGGWSDPRVILIFAYIGLLFLLYKIPKKQEHKLIALLIAGFNPHFLACFIQGQNDIFFFFLIILSLYLLLKNRFGGSAIAIGLACASKQPAWLILPFYAFYFLFRAPVNITYREKIWFVAKKLWPALAIFLIFVLPFFIWSPRNFLSDTIFYSTGGSSNSMPISGMNLGGLLASLNIISNTNSYLLFWGLLLIIGLPFLWWLLKIQKNNNHPSQLLINYTAFSLVFFLFFRFFNDCFLGYLILSALAAWSFSQRENEAE